MILVMQHLHLTLSMTLELRWCLFLNKMSRTFVGGPSNQLITFVTAVISPLSATVCQRPAGKAVRMNLQHTGQWMAGEAFSDWTRCHV